MKKKNIAIITTSRADYGLLYPLIKSMLENNNFNLELIVTGTHLSPMHGKTINDIENDGFTVHEKIEMTMKSDTEDAICNSIALGIIGFSGLFKRKNYDLVLVLGDRYELWSICMSAVIHKIPIAHMHGGEATFGLIDESIRHSVTKMASFHFPSIDIYAKRIIQMGENPDRVFTVGALGIDNINRIDLMEINDLIDYTGVNFKDKIALITYHPITLEKYSNAGKQVEEVLNAILETDLIGLITMPNSDTGGNQIFNVIQSFVELHPAKFKFTTNLGQKAYLSSMKYANIMIGNSSSGIIEAASFKLPVVNIGDRQSGRFKPENVVDCICTKSAILEAINRVQSESFKESISQIKNPYGDGNTAGKIINILDSIDLFNHEYLLKKVFFDFNNNFRLDNISRVI